MTARGVSKKVVHDQFKAWYTRKLNELGQPRENWWSENGSKRELYRENDLFEVMDYVIHQQEGERFQAS
ncbi:MAG: hypothetical protein U0796_19235 [Gemmatales bacterium]